MALKETKVDLPHAKGTVSEEPIDGGPAHAVTGQCSGCGQDDYLYVFNDLGKFCVDCEANGKAYGITPEAKAQQRRVISMAKKKDPRDCACGCGTKTGGGEFAMGHDAKHKSNLIATALGEDKDARKAAVKELGTRNWTKFLERKREIAAEKVAKAQAAKAAKPAPKAKANGKGNGRKGAQERMAAEQATELENGNGAEGIETTADELEEVLA